MITKHKGLAAHITLPIGVQSSFVRGAHQVDRVGVQEHFKVQLDTGYQTFTRLEGWQMGSDDEGVPILAHQPAGQRGQFCIPTPVSVVGDIGIGTCGSHSVVTQELRR